ncbi:MAG: superoxide dismutase [Fe] [Alphaproteobacteria bacterium]|nr:superoxide dismutase [Fe] [Alphaproteobacteria bacterium]
MPQITLPALPWAKDALAPVISAATVEKHHGAHHAGYVKRVNALIEGTDYADLPLKEIVLKSVKDPKARGLANAAGQTWNHNCYWESLSPDGGAPSAALAAQIEKDFGGLDALKEQLVSKGAAHFASGWVSLTRKDGALHILDTHDAETALEHGHAPLVVIDVWEHAYYLDYQNERDRHLRTIVDKLLDWRGASARFEAS